MSNLSEHESARIRKAGKTMANNLARTKPEHRAMFFSSIAKELDLKGEVSLCQLFAGIAGTYLKAMKVEEEREEASKE